MCSISFWRIPVCRRSSGIVQGFFQSMAKCMVPALSRWQMEPWLKATKGRPYL